MGFLSVLFVGKETAPAVERDVPYRWDGRKTGNETYESRDSHENSHYWTCTMRGPFLKRAYMIPYCIFPVLSTGPGAAFPGDDYPNPPCNAE